MTEPAPLPLAINDPDSWPVFLTTDEVAQILRVDVQTVQRWLREGRIPKALDTRMVRIRRTDLLSLPGPLPAEEKPPAEEENR